MIQVYTANQGLRLAIEETASFTESNGGQDGWAYRGERRQRLPPLPRPGREVREREGNEVVLILSEDGEKDGVKRRGSRVGRLGRWGNGVAHANGGAAELGGRVAGKLWASPARG